MAGIKRSHSETLVKSTHFTPSNASGTHVTDELRLGSDVEDSHSSKRSKYVHASSTEDEDETLEDAQGFEIQITQHPPASDSAMKADSGDNEMNEAAICSAEDDNALPAATGATPQPAMAPARPARVPPTSFTPLAPVLASDMMNNKHAPSDTTIQQHYLNEVGQLQLHPSRTPLQTPHSKVSAQIRNVIYERLFLGMTNNECIPTYNSFGGSVTRGASVSKAFLPEVWKWFEEENAILPWLGRKEEDKNRLKKLGLIPKNFPAPHATVVVVRKSNKKAKKPVTQAPTMAASQPGASTSAVAGPVLKATVEPDLVEFEDYEESASESECSESDSETEEVYFVARHKPDKTIHHVEFDEEDTSEPSIHDLMRAATNSFGRIGEEVSVVLVVYGTDYMVNAHALEEHCAFVRANTPEEGYRERHNLPEQDPAIVRAFIDTISPVARDSLPEHDVEFAETCDLVGEEHSDPLGMIYERNSRAQKIIWDIDTLVAMYQLAKTLRCTIVMDMVIDRILRLHRDEQRNNWANPVDEKKEFDLPLYCVPYLSLDKDAALIHCIGGILLNRTDLAGRDQDRATADFEWPEEFSDEMRDTIVGHYDACPAPGTETCQYYHAHGGGEQCYKVAGQDWKNQTPDLISELFTELRKRAAHANDEALRELQQGQEGHPDEDEFEVQQHLGEMMQFSLRREEKMAEMLYKIDRYNLRLAKGKGAKKQILRKKLLACRDLFEDCCRDYIARWDSFMEGWINDNEDYRRKVEDDLSNLLPWIGK